MNNKHQELIEEKVAEFDKKVDDDYYEVIELTDTTQLKSTLWTEEYWPESQVELSVDKVRAFLTQTLQDTIDTVLEGEREEIGAMIEEADYARKVGERTGEPIAVWEVQDVIRQIKALTPTQTK